MIWQKDSLVLGWSGQKTPWCQGWVSTKESFGQIPPNKRESFSLYFAIDGVQSIKYRKKTFNMRPTRGAALSYFICRVFCVWCMLDSHGARQSFFICRVFNCASVPWSWPCSSRNLHRHLYCHRGCYCNIKKQVLLKFRLFFTDFFYFASKWFYPDSWVERGNPWVKRGNQWV